MTLRQIRRVRRLALTAALALASATAPTTVTAQTQNAFDASLARVLARPADAEASFRFAQAASTEGRFREAIAALERVLILNPTLANIKLELGVLYLRLGQSALAERFIKEALASPDAPDDVRTRAQQLLAIAERGNTPFAVTNVLTFGMIGDTNANSGPTSGVEPEDTEQSDISAYLRWATRFSYDLGFQAGNSIIGGVDLYTRNYSDETQLDIDRFAGNLGMALNFGGAGPDASTLRVTVDAARLAKDGEDFLTEIGPTLALSLPVATGTAVEVSAFWRDQGFENTEEVTANDLRDGALSGVGLTLRRSVGDAALLTFNLRAADKSAEAGFEAYSDAGISIGYTAVADALFGVGSDKWRYGLTASTTERTYDEADTDAGETEEETARSYALTGSIEVPFESQLSFRTEIGVNGNSSTIEVNEFDNTFLSLSITKAF